MSVGNGLRGQRVGEEGDPSDFNASFICCLIFAKAAARDNKMTQFHLLFPLYRYVHLSVLCVAEGTRLLSSFLSQLLLFGTHHFPVYYHKKPKAEVRNNDAYIGPKVPDCSAAKLCFCIHLTWFAITKMSAMGSTADPSDQTN